MKINKIIAKGLAIGLLLNNLCLNSFANIDNIENTTLKSEIKDEWITGLADIPAPRTSYASGVVDGKIYIIGGGSTSNLSSHTSTVYVYDIDSDLWEQRSDISISLQLPASTVIGKNIYIIGGNTTSSHNTPSNKVYKYNTINGELIECADMPTARSGASVVLLNGKIYVIGGRISDSVYSDIVEIYDPKTDTWATNVASLNLPRTGLGAEVINGKIYAFGGKTSNTSYTNKVEVYNPELNEWTYLSSMNVSAGYFASTVAFGKIYAIGGHNGSSELNNIQEYDIAQDIWVNKSTMPDKKAGIHANHYNGKIYIVGGNSGSSISTTNIAYYIKELTLEDYALEAVEKAINDNNIENIDYARNLVNQLSEGDLKEELQNRLDAIVPNITLDIKNSTANLDLYIKSENMLLMNLSTNSITFEDYSGVDDLEKINTLNISINSSLPYQLNAYLLDEMYNSDKSKKIDIDRLNIKNNEDADYKEFTAVNDKLILKDDCVAGNNKIHNIDLKLKGSQAYEADIYKTVIKFEAEQK